MCLDCVVKIKYRRMTLGVNDAGRRSEYMTSNDKLIVNNVSGKRMNGSGYGPILGFFHRICLEPPRKVTSNPNQSTPAYI
jgi:hypothetical protein